MKKLSRVSAALLVIFMLFSTSNTFAASSLKVLYKGKTTANLNVRTSPSTKGKVLALLKKGSTVDVVGTASGGWLKINYKSGVAYVSGKYVKKSTAAVAKPAALKVLYKGTTTENLNVRSSASTKGKLLGTLKKGTTVEVVSAQSNGWLKIKYKSTYAYVSGKYVKKIEEKLPNKPEPEASKVLYKGKTTTDGLNVRTQPNTNGKILTSLKKGSIVEVTGEEKNGWLKIKHKDSYGYVSGKYVEKVKDETDPPTKPDEPKPEVPVTYPEGFSRTLRLGMNGLDVRKLQVNLNKAGYRVDIDNTFGESTDKAVKAFQKSINYKETGVAGPKTLTRLQDKAQNSPAYKGYLFTGKGWGHGVGMTQWGAKGMAEAGFNYHQILSHYYTGITFKTIDTSKKDVRIALSLGLSKADVQGLGNYTIQDMNGNVLFIPAKATATTITVQKGKFTLTNGNNTKTIDRSFKVVSEKGQLLYYDRHKYRGTLEISMSSSGKMDVVNRLNVEDYIQGVVPWEISPKWPTESIKAQILAARNYAVANIKSPASKFDMYNDERSQVYAGVNVEAANVNQFVQATKGEVIYYGNTLITAYFSSSAGGHTLDSELVWSSAVPYLRGVEDPYDKSDDTVKGWTKEMSFADLAKKFPEVGNEVIDIKVIQTSGGHAVKLRVTGDQSMVELKGDKFRSRVGLKSTMFTPTLMKN
ncbi:SpoIID/LytB domain-containing protein [Fictibacillus sp. Mic-4]|uniref:SpoIID/LytB domain-containing protein n=1 Tax=Fictibacillus sp. Mic-4 TaxID=3132826 RepID=UPI003CF5F06A